MANLLHCFEITAAEISKELVKKATYILEVILNNGKELFMILALKYQSNEKDNEETVGDLSVYTSIRTIQ